jgi:calcineurin-like phosphoesterase family protein
MNPDKLFFTSDTHFGHKLMLRLGRAFTDVDEMDRHLIECWNDRVPPGSDVFHLGDISFRKDDQTVNILRQLNGRLYLVTGNHDRGINTTVKSCFLAVAPYMELKVERQKIILFHFPIHSWHAVHHGSWHLHGHSHGSCAPLGKRMDVGVDCHALRPVSYREIERVMGTREVTSGDGHRPGMHREVTHGEA